MDTRPLGPGGPRVSVVGICPGEGPGREEVIRRASRLGCTLFFPHESLAAPGVALIRYNLLDQKEANESITRLARERKGVVAMNVLAGGALAGQTGHSYGDRIEQLRPLARPGRSLLQAAIQFVLANESVSAAIIRVASPAHVDEVLAAPDAPPLTGQDLELIFESWANRFG